MHAISREKKILSWLFFLSMALLLTTRSGTPAVFVLLFFWSLVFMLSKRSKFALNAADKWLIVALVFIFLSALPTFIASGFEGRYLDLSLRFLLAVPILLLCLNVRANMGHFFSGVIVGSLGALMVALYQYFYLHYPRVDGFLFSINFGYLACALAFLNLSALLYFSEKVHRLGAALGFVAALAAMLLSGTRGAYVAVLPLGLLLAFLYRQDIGRTRLWAALGLLVVASFSVYAWVPQARERIDSLIFELHAYQSGVEQSANTSAGLRLELWHAALEAFRRSPLHGMTYAQREALNAELVQQGILIEPLLEVQRGHAHSEIFEIMATRGLLGLCALLLLYAVPFIYFYRQAKAASGKIKALAVGGAVFVAGFAIYGLSEAPLQSNPLSIAYALVVIALYTGTRLAVVQGISSRTIAGGAA
jgi:O-antigen ligase